MSKKKEKSNPPRFKIRCRDGEYEFVDIKCVYESKKIRDFLEVIDCRINMIKNRGGQDSSSNCKYIDDRDIGFFSIMVDIPKHIVKMVEYYCISRFDIMTSYARRDRLLLNNLEVLNRTFLQDKPLPLLVQLQTAAIKLKIKSLLNLTRNAIVDMLDGKSADEIRRIFNMPDFKHDAWKNIYVQESWTIEQMSYTTSYQTYPKLLAPAVPNAEVIRVSDNFTYDSATNTSVNDLNNGLEVGNPGNNEGSESGLEEEVLDEPAPVQKNSNEMGPFKKPESFSTQEDKKSYASIPRAFKATGSSASGHVQTSNLRWAPANTDQHKPTPAKPFLEPETSVPVVVNDSGELKKAAAAAKLPILQEKRRKEKSKTWGSSPKDLDKLLAAVAKFPSLPINKKLVCVTALSFASINYEYTLKAARKKRKETQGYNKFGWTSDLYKKELEMIGDLDPNEAGEIYQKCYVGKSFEVLLHDEEDNRMLSKKSDLKLLDEVKSASSYNNESFVDSKFCESANEEAERPILLDRERKKILKECKSYLMKTEWLMDNWMRKKTEFILFDKGACSETKFNQSDDKHRKEMMLERHRKKMTGNLTARKKMAGEEGTDMFLAPSTALKDQSDKEKYEKERSLKDDDEADTVGCCTLKVENVEPEPPNILKLRAFKATGSSASGHVQTSNLRWAPANTDQHKPTPAKPFPEPETSVPVVVNDSESSNVPDDGHLIYVWNLPINVTVTQLEEEFNKFGPIKRNGVQVISNKQEGFCIGCLEFESLDSMHGAIMAPSITTGNRQVVVSEKTRVGGGREWYSFGRGDGFRGRGGYRGCLTSPYKSALLVGGDGGGGRVRYSSGKGGRFRSRGGYFGGRSFSRERGRSQDGLIGMRRPTLQGS